MTNLKGSSGTTGGAVHPPHSRLIFRLARWPSNCLFGGRRTALQKAHFCRKERFFTFCCGPRIGFLGRGQVDPLATVQHIYIYTHTGCLVGLGSFPAGLVGLGTRCHHNIAILNENTYFYSAFTEFGVCVCCWNLSFLVKCSNTAYIPGYWARCLQTLFY